jgi:hypothetical protein
VEVWNPLKRRYEQIGESIVGLAPSDLNSIELLAQAIDNDPNYFQTVAGASPPKRTEQKSMPTSLCLQAVNTKAISAALAALSSTVQTK